MENKDYLNMDHVEIQQKEDYLHQHIQWTRMTNLSLL
jgi:hypothetical protein